MEIFILKNVYIREVKEQYEVKIWNIFTVLENWMM